MTQTQKRPDIGYVAADGGIRPFDTIPFRLDAIPFRFDCTGAKDPGHGVVAAAGDTGAIACRSGAPHCNRTAVGLRSC